MVLEARTRKRNNCSCYLQTGHETMCLCNGFCLEKMLCPAALNDLWSVVKLCFVNWLFLRLVEQAAKLPLFSQDTSKQVHLYCGTKAS